MTDERPDYEIQAPPTRRGTRILLAVWLAQDIGLNGVFTIEAAEKMIVATTGVKRVEVDRRIRELAVAGWIVANYRTDRSLLPSEHRLIRIGDQIWHKNYRWPQGRARCPSPVRRYVFSRDGRVCVICGIRDREPFPDYPNEYARMTIGRILPGSKGGDYSIGNCQVECNRCNEAVQDKYDYGGDPPSTT